MYIFSFCTRVQINISLLLWVQHAIDFAYKVFNILTIKLISWPSFFDFRRIVEKKLGFEVFMLSNANLIKITAETKSTSRTKIFRNTPKMLRSTILFSRAKRIWTWRSGYCKYTEQQISGEHHMLGILHVQNELNFISAPVHANFKNTHPYWWPKRTKPQLHYSESYSACMLQKQHAHQKCPFASLWTRCRNFQRLSSWSHQTWSYKKATIRIKTLIDYRKCH